MKKIKTVLISFCFLLLLNSCGSFSEVGKVMRNEKIKSTDEFLVKKRDPLSLPPDYDVMPEPGSINSKKIDKNSIDQILKMPNEEQSFKKGNAAIEESIINQIRK